MTDTNSKAASFQAKKIITMNPSQPVATAITIDAAYILNKENELGSLRSGKLADMTVLEQDPYEVGVENLKDIKVWGTIFEGEVHPVQE